MEKPSYMSDYVLGQMMCGCSLRPKRKEDCFFYEEVQDMSAHIPTCNYHHKLGYCPCEDCEKYIKYSDVIKGVREYVDERNGNEKMISANEAREKTQAVRDNGVKCEVERIEREIQEAISKGDNNIALDGVISRPTAEYLRSLGYEVHVGSQYNESYFTIKW